MSAATVRALIQIDRLQPQFAAYNGYPGHGDPRHSAVPHIHLSWQHAPAAPFSRAAWVRVIRPGASR